MFPAGAYVASSSGEGQSGSTLKRNDTQPRGAQNPPEERAQSAGFSPLDPACQLLDEGRYDEAAELVEGAARRRKSAGEQTGAEMLSAAYELCLACREHQHEAEAHGRAQATARHREASLRMRIAVLLRRAGQGIETAQVRSRGGTPRARARRAAGTPRRLEVRCLGRFRVDLNGTPLGPWPNKRAAAVFKHLVLDRQQPRPKEILMDHLWPDADGDAARNNLNVAVHALRRFLRAADVGPSQVVFRDGCYALDPAIDVWVDVAEFRRLARRRSDRDRRREEEVCDLQEAMALYVGPLFEDDPYEEWIIPLRREFEQIYLGVLDRLRMHHFGAAEYESAIVITQKLLALEPFREDAHRDLMRSYARRGQEHLALRQFQTCATDLHEHLDADPAADTVALRDGIRAHLPV
jgi:DNA-binding SARP family transcriptional activator